MYKIGQKISYGQTGVCEVVDICYKEFIKKQKQQYYILKPIFAENNIIYAPTTDSKIFMRSLITKKEAEKLVDTIPLIIDRLNQEAEITKEDYLAKINNHSLEDLVELTSIIYLKKQNAYSLKRRLNNIDEKYLKIGENLLFGELAQVLGIPFEDVQKYIESRLKKGSIG